MIAFSAWWMCRFVTNYCSLYLGCLACVHLGLWCCYCYVVRGFSLFLSTRVLDLFNPHPYNSWILGKYLVQPFRDDVKRRIRPTCVSIHGAEYLDAQIPSFLNDVHPSSSKAKDRDKRSVIIGKMENARRRMMLVVDWERWWCRMDDKQDR